MSHEQLSKYKKYKNKNKETFKIVVQPVASSHATPRIVCAYTPPPIITGDPSLSKWAIKSRV